MKEEQMKDILQALKNRQEIPKKYMSVGKMLEVNNMENYENVCCNRIAEFFDDEHVLMDLFSDRGLDITLDEEGLNICENVLKGYISNDKLQGYKKYIRLQNEIIESCNVQIRAMWDCPTDVIKKALRNPAKYMDNVELAESFKCMLSAELRARRWNNKVKRFIGGYIEKLCFYIKNIGFYGL